MKPKKRMPNTPQKWLAEVAVAYIDALETLPMAKLMGRKVGENDLFQLAPIICLKVRGLPRTKDLEAKATEAALSTYIATESHYPETVANAQLAFALAYLASHYGLDLLTEDEVEEIMDFIARKQKQLAMKVKRKSRKWR